MYKYQKILAFIFALFMFPMISGASNIQEYKLELQDFSELKVTDGINVEYHCSTDTVGMAFFSCTKEMLPMLIFNTNKSSLSVQLDPDAEGLTEIPTVHVYSSKLEKVENSSDSTVVVRNNTLLPSFKVRLIGNGAIIVHNIVAATVDAGLNTGKGRVVLASGSVAKAKLLNVGTGTVEAGGLEAKNVTVKLFGTGGIDCCATESLTIYGAGSGTAYYTGNPAKVTNRSLGVKAININDKPL